MTAARTLLVLGGVRAGKSAFAMARARAAAAGGARVAFVATAEAGDPEMAERIGRHRAERPVDWQTVEVPLALPEALGHLAGQAELVLVDCLTLWVANLLGRDSRLGDDALLRGVARLCPPSGHPFDLVLVSNEVGLGVHPGTQLGRRFRDALGLVNQAVARAADEVVLLVSGLPVWLKERKER